MLGKIFRSLVMKPRKIDLFIKNNKKNKIHRLKLTGIIKIFIHNTRIFLCFLNLNLYKLGVRHHIGPFIALNYDLQDKTWRIKK